MKNMFWYTCFCDGLLVGSHRLIFPFLSLLARTKVLAFVRSGLSEGTEVVGSWVGFSPTGAVGESEGLLVGDTVGSGIFSELSRRCPSVATGSAGVWLLVGDTVGYSDGDVVGPLKGGL